jgi:hypothetical protein
MPRRRHYSPGEQRACGFRPCRSASAAERERAGRPALFCRRMAIPILWRDGSRIEIREQEQNRASGAFASLRLLLRAPQLACSLLLLSPACAKRASFRGPFLPSTEGCPLILAPYAPRLQTRTSEPYQLPQFARGLPSRRGYALQGKGSRTRVRLLTRFVDWSNLSASSLPLRTCRVVL